MVRLVKGAYWDTEIKRAQERGLAGYPVFTRKAATDVSYLACAQALLRGRRGVLSAVRHAQRPHAGGRRWSRRRPARFEFQRLHGMGEALYEQSSTPERRPCRVYAPVGSHEDLLAYLVRRLLENGANTSFVNRLADDAPAGRRDRRRSGREASRRSSQAASAHPAAGRHLSAPTGATRPGSISTTCRRLRALDGGDGARRVRRRWHGGADHRRQAAAPSARAQRHRSRRPPPRRRRGDRGDARPRSIAALAAAATAAPRLGRDAGGASARAILERAADLYEKDHARADGAARARGRQDPARRARRGARGGRFLPLLRRARARGVRPRRRSCRARPASATRCGLHGRGVFVCISPWNFPLAIFTGQIAAALAAGNAVARQARRADAADRRARGGAAARGRRARRRAASAARRRADGRRAAGRRSARRRRRLHRLDRDRARDQPGAGRARRADRAADRRDRRA